MILSRFRSGSSMRRKARPRPVAGHRRALQSPATLAPKSLVLSHLRPLGGGVKIASSLPPLPKPSAAPPKASPVLPPSVGQGAAPRVYVRGCRGIVSVGNELVFIR